MPLPDLLKPPRTTGESTVDITAGNQWLWEVWKRLRNLSSLSETYGLDEEVVQGDVDASSVSNQTYELAWYKEGVMAGSENLFAHYFRHNVTFPDDFNDAGLKALVAATASTTLTVKKDGTSVGTIVVAAAGTTATFSTTGGVVTYETGTWMTVTAPATADATLADVACTLKGTVV